MKLASRTAQPGLLQKVLAGEQGLEVPCPLDWGHFGN